MALSSFRGGRFKGCGISSSVPGTVATFQFAVRLVCCRLSLSVFRVPVCSEIDMGARPSKRTPGAGKIKRISERADGESVWTSSYGSYCDVIQSQTCSGGCLVGWLVGWFVRSFVRSFVARMAGNGVP